MSSGQTRFGRSHRAGSTMVESVFVLMTVLLVVIGIFDFGRLMFCYNSLRYATMVAARYGANHGSSSKTPASSTTIQNVAKAQLIGIDSSLLTTTVTWTPNKDPGSTVKVKCTYAFSPLAGAMTLIADPLPITSTSTLLITN